MAQTKSVKTRVFMSGRSQHVTIPAQFRFGTEEVYVRRDPSSGDLVLSAHPGNWQDFFTAVDAAPLPDDFLLHRKQGKAEARESL